MNNLNKIKKMQEALKKPQARTNDSAVVDYGPSTSTEEEIGRKIKSTILPKLSDLCQEVEYLYNNNTYGEFDEKTSKKRELLLKPIENLYAVLKKADKDMINFLNDLSGKNED